MKHLLSVLILCITAFANAQILNIPDSIFKKQLIEQFDANRDGELQTSEALAIEVLSIKPIRYNASNDCGFIDIYPGDFTGIEKFTNLKRFACNYRYSDVKYAGMEYTSPYYCIKGPATSARNLSFKNNTKLKYLSYTGDSSISRIDLSGCINLDTMFLSAFPQNEEYGPYNNNFDNLDLSGCRNLKYAFISYFFGLKTLNLQGCDSLSTLYLYGMTGIENYDVHGLPNLKEFIVLHNSYPGPPVSVNASNTPKLNLISVYWDEIASVNVSGCSALSSIYINTPNFSSEYLDLSTVPSLKALALYIGGGRLSYLNLKNGSSLNNYSGLEVNPPLQYICADDFEVSSLRQYFFDYKRQYVNINPYCNFGPAGKYNTITGNAKINIGGNTCDASSPAVKQMPVKIENGSQQFVLSLTDAAGKYKTYTGKGNFKLSPYFPYPYYNVTPVNTSVSFDTANSLLAVNDFCITPNGAHDDLEITFLPLWPPSRPGFDAAYQLVYKNRGTTTLTGNVQVNFDNSKMNFVAAGTAVASQTTGQLIWNYINLQPFESRKIDVTFNILPPPVNNIDDTLNWLATINPSANDETPYDNSFILPQRVVGAYDPNDKQCLEGSKLDISKIGNYLHYQIRFQNEGTDTAFNIVVADTLSNKLDWNSFELINSSHPCAVNLNGNKAEFIFENIKLPYKSINEPASHGWVSFKIKPKPIVLIGDSLDNKAAIYFDFNLPVITNTATTIVSSASSTTPVKLEYFSVNRKENKSEINWKANCTYGNANFIIERSIDGRQFSAIGNITANSIRCRQPFSFTDNTPAQGNNYYRLKITDADGKIFYSKIALIKFSLQTLELTAISNTHNSTEILFTAIQKEQIKINIVAADGKLIYSSNKRIVSGSSKISLPLNNNASGIYTVIVYTQSGIITKRFIL